MISASGSLTVATDGRRSAGSQIVYQDGVPDSWASVPEIGSIRRGGEPSGECFQSPWLGPMFMWTFAH